MERRLEAVASNIANLNTAGYRAVGVRFSTELKQVGQDQISFASPGETYVIRNQGPMTHTGNSLDAAVDGDGWFALDTPDGTVYTRDGRFHLTANGPAPSTATASLTAAARRSPSTRPPGRWRSPRTAASARAAGALA
jgi:flagellar basal-body rod protein FlgF